MTLRACHMPTRGWTRKMPRRLPQFVDANRSKGRMYFYFRRGKGDRIRLPDDPSSEEFNIAYISALAGRVAERERFTTASPGTMAALVASYKASHNYQNLRTTTKNSYATPLERLRVDHRDRLVSQMTKSKIENVILAPYLLETREQKARPGQALAILKVLRVLIKHAIANEWLSRDPSAGIKRPRTKEIRSWKDEECERFERRWPLGTKQRTAYALMLWVGAARVDVHKITWPQLDHERARYTRNKTGITAEPKICDELQEVLNAAPREHITVINTEFGRPFTIKGFGNFMRDAMNAAGLPMDCKPHGLRKTLGRRLAEAGISATWIMAILGHRTLAEAERYTRDAERTIGAWKGIEQLETVRRQNRNAQTASGGLGKVEKEKGNQRG